MESGIHNAKDGRPPGLSSRAFPADGDPQPWAAPNGAVVPLPLVIDNVMIGDDGDVIWHIQATVRLVGNQPMMTALSIREDHGMNPVTYSTLFRWGTPIALVWNVIPDLIATGVDIWAHYLPTDAPELSPRQNRKLSDEFLRFIVNEYERIGSGYQIELSRRFGVSTRTVVSWMEKARSRGLAAPATKGHITRRAETPAYETN